MYLPAPAEGLFAVVDHYESRNSLTAFYQQQEPFQAHPF
jgi:hypothetical protein